MMKKNKKKVGKKKKKKIYINISLIIKEIEV